MDLRKVAIHIASFYAENLRHKVDHKAAMRTILPTQLLLRDPHTDLDSRFLLDRNRRFCNSALPL